MAEMQFDLVSPERRLASYAANAVAIPGTDGDMTVMPDHAPTITTLRPGILVVTAGSDEHSFVVTGGFAEIGTAGVSVLAEEALPKAEAAGAFITEKIEAAQAAVKAAPADAIDAAQKRVADLEALAAALA